MYNKLNASAKSYNFHFYMAHDTTIAMALNALHLTSTECLKNAYENKTTDCITTVNIIIIISLLVSLICHKPYF
jgi:hypothetical protein